MGCVTYSARFFANGEISASGFQDAYYHARLELRNIEQNYKEVGWADAIGSSGSIKSVASILEERGENCITRKGLEALKKELLRCKRVDRINFQGLKPERRSIFPAGLAILTAAFDTMKLETMSYSEGALREGLLYDMVGRQYHENVRQRTLRALVKRFHIDEEHADRVRRHADILIGQVADKWPLRGEDRFLLHSAALMHEIGLDISHTQFHRHGAYIVRNVDLLGFTNQQQHHLSMMVRGHRRTLPLHSLYQLPRSICQLLLKLLILLRLAIILNHIRSNKTPEYQLSIHNPETYPAVSGRLAQ